MQAPGEARTNVAGASDAAADAGAAPRIVIERPPPGLARGKFAWPAWGIASVGIATIALTLVYLAWRLRRRRRK